MVREKAWAWCLVCSPMELCYALLLSFLGLIDQCGTVVISNQNSPKAIVYRRYRVTVTTDEHGTG